MKKLGQAVMFDGEVASGVLNVVRDADKHVVLVSPYITGLHKWGHLLDALRVALGKRVKVTVILRDPRDKSDEWNEEDIACLADPRIETLAVEGLHAKIYLNEHYVVVSSMNLTESSTTNSHEFALTVQDATVEERVREYVEERLKASAERVEWSPASGEIPQETTQVRAVASTGACIRCGRSVPLDPGRPLCNDCYASWAEWKNEHYLEEYCHVCGNAAEVSYARPLCRSCYRS